jgi:two-component system OmpR family sensor kinase
LLPLAIHDLHEIAEGDHDGDMGESLSEQFDEGEAYLVYQIRDATGKVLLRSHDAPAQGFAVALQRGFADADDLRVYTEASRNRQLFVQVADQVDRRNAALRQILAFLAMPLVALVLASVMAVKLILRSATLPLQKLQDDIRVRGGSDLSPITPAGLPDELQPIVEAVNRLMARLTQLIQSERAFAANSAHELRTPLAAARAQAQLLADDLKDKREGLRATNILGLLDRLSRLVEKLLQLSRAEAGVGMSATCRPLEVAEIIADEYRSRSRHNMTPIRLAADPAADRELAIDQDALGIVLHNLIDNALAHGSRESTVQISIGPRATLSVVNQGTVISPDEMPKLRERFSRGTAAGDGSGLGLSIVDTIMRQVGGRMDLYSPARGREDGFEVVLTFRPIA